MSKVLIVATSRKTRGGITAVIKAYENGKQWKDFHCHWVQTHRDGSSLVKIIYFLTSVVDYMIRLPFYDIVHIHISLKTTVKRKLLFAKLAKLCKKKLIVHLHCGTQINSVWNQNYEYMFNNADVSILLSESLKPAIEKYCKPKRLITLYNPCPTIDKNKITLKQKHILFSGTLYKEKGYRDLISAFAKIAFEFPEWKLIIAGNGEISTGMQLAKKYGIENQVEYLGWVNGDKKDRVFREASVFCLPSYAEGFPMAVLDAWSYGLPVITTPVGGIQDIAEDGENILLFPPGDIDTLAEKIKLIIRDDDLYEKIVLSSNKFYETIFNQNTINRQLGDIYSELSNE